MAGPAADVDSGRDFALLEIEHGDLGVGRCGDVGGFAVRRDRDAVRLKAHVDRAGFGQLLAVDFQQRDLARVVAADEERLAVRREGDADGMIADSDFVEHLAVAVRTSEAVSAV